MNVANASRSLAAVICAGLFACAGGSSNGDESVTTQSLDAGGATALDAGQTDSSDTAPKYGGTFHFTGPGPGFGGGNCTATHTPIIFIHGNTNDASAWLKPSSTGGPSVVQTFQAAGYNACELFGLSYLTPAQMLAPNLNYHDETKANLVRSFIAAVLAYTGKTQVDLVGHSMGVTVGLHALEAQGESAVLRRFIAVAGGMHGLDSCLLVGNANPAWAACGSQNFFDSQIFGFYPTSNPRMQSGGFRARPASIPGARFYTIWAGQSDEILCAAGTSGCSTALFDSRSNVIAQLDVGVGHPLQGNDDDTSGVGHFRARSDEGPLMVKMLTTTCAGAACCSGTAGNCAQ